MIIIPINKIQRREITKDGIRYLEVLSGDATKENRELGVSILFGITWGGLFCLTVENEISGYYAFALLAAPFVLIALIMIFKPSEVKEK